MAKSKIVSSFIPLFLLFMVSCSENSGDLTNYPFLQKKDENITLLFSDEQTINAEGDYYDALLDVKRRHPEKIRFFNVIHSSERELISYYEIEHFPTLLVIHNKSITLRIEGILKKVEILQLLEQGLLQ